MSYNKWTAEEEHLLKLLISTNSYQEISEEFQRRVSKGIAGFSSERTAEAIRKKCDRDNITSETFETYENNDPFRKTFDALKKLQAKFSPDKEVRRIGLTDGEIKIVSLSDIHFPFSRDDLLEQVIEEHKDADIFVINGDMLESYSASMFPKSKKVPMLIEYQCAFKFVKLISELVPHVVLVNGNHDARASRYMKDTGFPEDVAQVLRPDLLARIANGEELDDTGMLVQKHEFANVHYEQSESWYVKIGKTLFVHPWNRGGSAPGYTVKKVNDYFSRRYKDSDYDSVVVGHTHKLYQGIINSKLLIEQGCFADVMDYAFSPKMQYNSDNGMNGYAIIYQDKDGNTDFNKSGFKFLGEVLPPKKSAIDLSTIAK